MRKVFFLLLIVMFAFLLRIQSSPDFLAKDSLDIKNINLEKNESLQRASFPNWWENEMLTVEGHGFQPEGNSDIRYGKSFAKKAAMMDGYRNLAEMAGKVQITADETLTERKVDAVIKFVKVISETYDEQGNCTVVLSVPIYGVTDSFAQAAFSPVDKEDFPEPTKNVVAKGNYTGLIIDCGDFQTILKCMACFTLFRSLHFGGFLCLRFFRCRLTSIHHACSHQNTRHAT